MAGIGPKAAEEIRQGLGVLCVGVVLVVLGIGLDSDAGDLIRAIGVLAALLGLGVLAYALLVRKG